MTTDKTDAMPEEGMEQAFARRAEADLFSSLPVYPGHPDSSAPANPDRPEDPAAKNWARRARLVGRCLGAPVGGIAAGLDAYERWGALGMIGGALGGALIGALFVGEVVALGWWFHFGLPEKWFAYLRNRQARRSGEAKVEEDPAWQAVHDLMREKKLPGGDDK